MPTKSNYYELLGLEKDATVEEIRRAYHEAALKLHPDVSTNPKANDLFLEIQDAYNVLIDQRDRKAYDKRILTESNYPISIDMMFSRSTVTIFDESQLVYALVELSSSKKFATQPTPPINVCLIIDRSTSMHGVRLDTVKTAAIELIRQLKPNDLISIITFSDRAEVLVPAGQRSDNSVIENQIRMMRAGGGTEIFQGLETGFDEVRRSLNKTLINHIILLTDGRTYGDENQCLELADRAAANGIRITGLGMGTDWNDDFLEELTTRTGGSSFYISKISDIHEFLQVKFQSLNQIFAERVTLDLKTGSGVQLNSVFRLQPDTADLPIRSSIRLGSIPKNDKLSLLIEFVVAPISKDVKRLILGTGDLSLVLPFDLKFTSKIPISLTRLTGESPNTELPPRPIFQALSQISLYRMQEKARQEVSEGKVQEASKRLQRLATQLLSIGAHDLAQTALVEAERIQQTHLLSSEGEKKIKYGTRSLLLPARAGGEIEQ
jgi:Ca-activated chloride channel family protein